MQDIITGAAGRSFSPTSLPRGEKKDAHTAPLPAGAAAKEPTANPAETAPHERRKTSHRVRTERGSLWVMAATAALGAVGGLLAAKHGAAPLGVLLSAQGSFLALFWARVMYGGAFLLAEYILGFFALGGAFVWTVPLLCGMGAGLSLAGAAENTLFLLPAAVLTVAAAVLGADLSSGLSGQLLRVLSGSRTGLVITNGTAAGYTLRFLGLLAVNIAAGLVEAGIKISLWG